MRALVVYESMYGSTHIIAGNIADSLRSDFEVTLVPVAEASWDLVADADLLVADAPTHMHGLPTRATWRMAAEAGGPRRGRAARPARGPGCAGRRPPAGTGSRPGRRRRGTAGWQLLQAGEAERETRGRCAAGAMRGQDTAPTTPEPAWMPLVTLRASRPASDPRD
jgi:hypothetical protein